MSLQDAAEKSPALFVLGLLLTGFLAGLGTYKGLHEFLAASESTALQASRETAAALAAKDSQIRDLQQQLQHCPAPRDTSRNLPANLSAGTGTQQASKEQV